MEAHDFQLVWRAVCVTAGILKQRGRARRATRAPRIQGKTAPGVSGTHQIREELILGEVGEGLARHRVAYPWIFDLRAAR